MWSDLFLAPFLLPRDRLRPFRDTTLLLATRLKLRHMRSRKQAYVRFHLGVASVCVVWVVDADDNHFLLLLFFDHGGEVDPRPFRARDRLGLRTRARRRSACCSMKLSEKDCKGVVDELDMK